MSNNSVCLYFPIGKSCGGAERRLIRTFGAMFPDESTEVSILIHDIGMTDALKAEIDDWANGRARYFCSLSELLMYLLRSKFKWICAATLGYKTALVFFVATLYGTKRLFACVHNRSSMLLFINKKASRMFRTIVSLSSRIDTLYPYSLDVLKKEFPKKEISLTPGSFTDLSKYMPSRKQNVIVFASTLTSGKGVELLLDAISMVKNELVSHSYKCQICGDGPLLNYVLSKVLESNIESVVDIVGRVDTKDYLPQAAIFCSLQTPTNYPSQSLLEAMACGCYCIVTNTGESHMMVNKAFGALIENDAETLAAEIKTAICLLPDELKRISCAAREFVLKNFTIDKTVYHYQTLIRDRF